MEAILEYIGVFLITVSITFFGSATIAWFIDLMDDRKEVYTPELRAWIQERKQDGQTYDIMYVIRNLQMRVANYAAILNEQEEIIERLEKELHGESDDEVLPTS